MKTRKQKEKEYQQKYGHIPIDYYERLNWMVDQYKVSPAKMDEILQKRSAVLNNLQYFDYQVVQLLEEPEGASRPKVRVNTANYVSMAKQFPNMVHVYVPNAKADSIYMRRLTEHELDPIEGLIATPCMVDYDVFIRTPALNITDIFLCEIGLIRPPFKPDWDNIGKKYCDMYNENVWMDDASVIDGAVHKYYSILPRVEIRLRYMNCIYTKKFYNAITARSNFDDNFTLRYLDNKGEIVC